MFSFFNILVLVLVLVGGRLVASVVSDTSCSCAKTGTNEWCSVMKMTDLWREMMHEKLISEVKLYIILYELRDFSTTTIWITYSTL